MKSAKHIKYEGNPRHAKGLQILSDREYKRLAKRAASMALAAAMAASTLCAPALAVNYDAGNGTVHTGTEGDNIMSWQDGENAEWTEDNKYNHTEKNDNEINITGDGSTVDTNDQILDVGDNTTGVNGNDHLDINISDVTADVEDGESAIEIGSGAQVNVNIEDSNITTHDADTIHIEDSAPADSASSVTLNLNDVNITTDGQNISSVYVGEDTVGTLILSAVTITSEDTGVELNSDVQVVLDDTTITSEQGAAMSVESGSATIELDGVNELTGGYIGYGSDAYAGLNLSEGTNVTIKDEDSNGSLTANGGRLEDGNTGPYAGGAGIGSNNNENMGDLTITGGTITANGGKNSAGIGTGHSSSVSENAAGSITITGGNVTATGGNSAAGIGTGANGKIESITISGGEVNANAASADEVASSQSNYKIDGGAGIGTGEAGTVGTITIQNTTEDIVAYGGGEGTDSNYYGHAAGIGAGWNGAIDKIEINNCSNIEAKTIGEGGVGIGSGYGGSSVNSILIENSKVTATGGKYGSGVGSGSSNSTVGTISIKDSELQATGGEFAAGIGTGFYQSTVNKIEIDGGRITANGGSCAAGIGTGYGYGGAESKVDTIEIIGGNITANGGSYGAGIGTGYNYIDYGLGSTVETIRITGGKIHAVSGKYASGIGNGMNGSGGKIVITDGVQQLYAMGDYYFAIDTRADVSEVTASILNGKFLEELDKEDSNGLNKREDATFNVLDEEGNVVYTFTLTYDEEYGYLYDSFAFNLPAGRYTIVNAKPEGASEEEEAAYGGKQVQGDPLSDEAKDLVLIYEVKDGAMSTYDRLQFYTPTGGNGGGEETNPTPDPDDEPELILTPVPEEEIPLAPAPVEEIPEEETPLVDAPVIDESLEEIGEEDVPLASAPKTGDESGAFGLMAVLSGMALAVMSFFGKKKEQ